MRTIEHEGNEHTWIPANPSMRAAQLLSGDNSNDSIDKIETLVAKIDGKAPKHADIEVQWKVWLAAFSFLAGLFGQDSDLLPES